MGAIPQEPYRPFFALDELRRASEDANTPTETCGGADLYLRGGLEGIRTPDLGLDRAAC